MPKKIFFALMSLFVGIMIVSFCSNKASALGLNHDSEIYKKIIRQNIKACYQNEPLSSKVFPKDWPNNEFNGLFGDATWVTMPTGYTLLKDDNTISCKGLIYGDKLGSGASGEYAGILNIYGKNISGTSGLEEKKKLAIGLGYEPSSGGELDNPDAPLYYTLKYAYVDETEMRGGCKTGTNGWDEFWDEIFTSTCEWESGPYEAAAYEVGTKVNENGTVASNLEIFSSGNGTDLEEAGIYYKENSDKSGGTFSIKCADFTSEWETAFALAIGGSYDYEEGFKDGCIDDSLSVSYNKTIWNDGDATTGKSATKKSVVGFLNTHLPLEFKLHHNTNYPNGNYIYHTYVYEANGTISNDKNYTSKDTNITLPGQYNKIARWDDRAVKGMEYFTGGTNRIFTDSEIYVLYAGYLTDYYKADFQCGADKAEYYAGREGYTRASNILYDGEMQDECYVKATENADKKVNGVSSYNFNGADRGGGMVFHGQKTFEQLLNQIADLNVTPESIAEANITNSQSGTSDDPSDPCYNAGVEGMSWILCPAINNTSQAVGAIEQLLRGWLQIDPDNTVNKDQTREAWNIFRNIANAVMIILLLVIIFSQLTGVGIDNYGIKKMLPKLIIMGVLINLSYILCELAVDLSNILGVGLDNMFKSIGYSINPNGGADLTAQAIVAVVLAIISAGGVVAGIAISSGGGVMIIISLLLALAVALVAVLMFFVMLGARMIIVILFTIISPVAFALYILPNTQNLFKKWWKVFQAALVVYPICGALYGMSVVIKAIVINGDGSSIDFIPGLIAVVAPFLPFLLLPTLLRSALAGLGVLGGTLTMLGNGLRKGVSGGKGAIENTKAYKGAQERAANRSAERRAQRIYDRLNGVSNLSDSQRRRLYQARTLLNERIQERAQDTAGAFTLDDNTAQSRAEAARNAQEYRAAQDQYVNYSRDQLLAEAGFIRDSRGRLVAGVSSIMSQPGGSQKMRALIEAMEANGMERNISSMLKHNDVSGDAAIMSTLASSKNKVLKAYGKKGAGMDYDAFMTGTGNNSMRGYISSKGKEFLDGLDDKALAEIASYGGSAMGTGLLVEAAASTKNAESLTAINGMLSGRSDVSLSGKQLAGLDVSTVNALLGNANARRAMLMASDDIAANPELISSMSESTRNAINRLRTTHGGGGRGRI